MDLLPPELWDRVFSLLPVSALIGSVVRVSRTFHTLAWRQIGPRIVITEIPSRETEVVHRVEFSRVFAHMKHFGITPYIRALRKIKLADSPLPALPFLTQLESLSRLELLTITREEVPLLTHLTSLEHLVIGTYRPLVLPPLLASLTSLTRLRHLALPIRIAPRDQELSSTFLSSLAGLTSLRLSQVSSKIMLAGLEALTGLRLLMVNLSDSMDFNPEAVANTVTNDVIVSALSNLHSLRQLSFGSYMEGPDLRAVQRALADNTSLTALRLEQTEPLPPATNVWHVMSRLGSILGSLEVVECPFNEQVTPSDLTPFAQQLTSFSWIDSNAARGLLASISVLSALYQLQLVNIDVDNDDLLNLTTLRRLSSLVVSTHRAIHVPAVLRLAIPLSSSLKRLSIRGQGLTSTRLSHPTVLQHLTFLERLELPLTQAQEERGMEAELTHDEIITLVEHYQRDGRRGVKRSGT